MCFQRATLLAAFLSAGHSCLVVAQASMVGAPKEWSMVTWGQVRALWPSVSLTREVCCCLPTLLPSLPNV
jgi:hypothetical protein